MSTVGLLEALTFGLGRLADAGHRFCLLAGGRACTPMNWPPSTPGRLDIVDLDTTDDAAAKPRCAPSRTWRWWSRCGVRVRRG